MYNMPKYIKQYINVKRIELKNMWNKGFSIDQKVTNNKKILEHNNNEIDFNYI